MEKACAKCGLRFRCGADTPDCWCKGVAAWQPLRERAMEQYADCLCQTCLSLAFFAPSVQQSVWGIGRKGRF